MGKLDIPGLGTYTVDDAFGDLPQDRQQSIVNELRASIEKTQPPPQEKSDGKAGLTQPPPGFDPSKSFRENAEAFAAPRPERFPGIQQFWREHPFAAGIVGGAANAIPMGVPRGGAPPLSRAQIAGRKDILRQISRDETTPEAIQKAAKPGQILAESGGQNIRDMVERIAQSSGTGRKIIVESLTERQKQQEGRISSGLKELAGTERSARRALEETVAEQVSAATPAYRKAYAAGDVEIWNQSTELQRLTGASEVQEAMHGAVKRWQTNAIADGYGGLTPGAWSDRGGILQFPHGKPPVFPNIQFWDYTKRILDDMVREARNAGSFGRARDLTKITNKMVSELDKIVPEFAEARLKWATPQQYRDALEDGQSIMSRKMSAEDVQAEIRSYPENAQQGYREAAVSDIVRTMRSDPARMPDLTKYLRSPEMRDKVAALMRTPEQAQAWRELVTMEEDRSSLTGQALGNSATARRQAAMADAERGDLIAQHLLGIATGGKTHFLGKLPGAAKWTRDLFRQRANREAAKILTGPETMDDLRAALDVSRPRSESILRSPPTDPRFLKGTIPGLVQTLGQQDLGQQE